jgi:hypothetical protein
MGARFPIPRPTETAALASVRSRRYPAAEAMFSDLATTYQRSDREGFTLLGCLILRAIAGKAGERS